MNFNIFLDLSILFKKHVPLLVEAISDTDKLCNALWAVGLITDMLREDVLYTTGQTKYQKANKIVDGVYKCLKMSIN